MPISKSINLLQNPIDIPDSRGEEYYIQALANLGQRIGIKGDGIAYKSFSFLDSISYASEYSIDEYIGYLKYANNSNNELIAEFGVVKKDLSEYTSLETLKSINNILYFPNDLTLPVIMNNVEKYSKNSIIVNEDGFITMMLVEKLIGYDDDDLNNSILQYYKFDINNNKLLYSAKIYFAYSDGLSNYYALIKTSHIEGNNYKTTIHLFNSSILNDFKYSFEEAFKFSSYNKTNDIAFSLLRPEYVDLEILEAYNDNSINNYFESNSPVAIILHNSENKYKYKSYEIDLTFDTNTNLLMSIDENAANEIYAICKDEYELENIDEEINLLNSDINQLYYIMFNYYNTKFYTEQKYKFFQRILCKTYEESSNRNYNGNIMYFPLDYTIDYMCNSSDEMQIYFSNNIYVTYTTLSDKKDICKFWNENTNIVFDYDSIEKIKVYAFNILYNSKYNDVINSVNIKDVYTMPYINANENWSINNADTKIKAKGDDAGNPNIIIIYSKDKNNTLDSYKVLTSIVNNEVIENCEFEKRSFFVDNALFESINNIDIKCDTYMPIITDINYPYFKNAIIINICELDCLENEGIISNYLGSNILSLWHLSYERDEIKYVPILKENSICAIPFGSTINILNETSEDYIAKINAQDILLLKSVINTLAQENMSLHSNNWLVIKNKVGTEYENLTSGSSYLNNLNAIIQYNDNVIVENNIVKTNQNKKYVNDISNLDITNAIYPKYDISIKTAEMTGEQLVDLVEDDLVQRNVSKIVIDNETITNIDEVYEEISQIIKDKTTETFIYNVYIETENKLNANYNEYVFNSDIPSLDLKEVFVRNFDVLNRVNIISIDNNGNAYNGYIGSSFNEQSKSTLHIGTSKTNINIGSDSLMSESNKMKFNTHDKISIDFDNIELNSKNSTLTNNPIIIKKSINGITFYSSSIYMLDSLMNSPIQLNNINNIASSWNSGDTSLFCKDNNGDYYIYINNVLSTIFNENTLNYNVIVNDNLERNILTIENDKKMYFYKLNCSPFDNLLNKNIVNFGRSMNVTYYKGMNGEEKTIYLYININNIN